MGDSLSVTLSPLLSANSFPFLPMWVCVVPEQWIWSRDTREYLLYWKQCQRMKRSQHSRRYLPKTWLLPGKVKEWSTNTLESLFLALCKNDICILIFFVCNPSFLFFFKFK